MNSGAPERLDVPAPVVIPIVLPLKDRNIIKGGKSELQSIISAVTMQHKTGRSY